MAMGNGQEKAVGADEAIDEKPSVREDGIRPLTCCQGSAVSLSRSNGFIRSRKSASISSSDNAAGSVIGLSVSFCELKIVASTGVEPALPCENTDLNRARLPIPPRGQRLGDRYNLVTISLQLIDVITHELLPESSASANPAISAKEVKSMFFG